MKNISITLTLYNSDKCTLYIYRVYQSKKFGLYCLAYT